MRRMRLALDQGLAFERPQQHPVHRLRGVLQARAAHPAVRGLERAIERDFTPEDIAAVKAWLVATAQRLERITQSRAA